LKNFSALDIAEPVETVSLEEVLSGQVLSAVQPPRIPHDRRVINALRRFGYESLADKIENCRKGARCGSYWCGKCRHASAKGLELRLSRRFCRFEGDHAQAVKDLRWVTVIHDFVPLDVGKVEKSLKKGKHLLHTVRRHFPDIWIRGAWELEVIDVAALAKSDGGKGSVKLDTLKTMLGRKCSSESFLLLVHFHVVVDLNGHSEVEFKRWLRRRKVWKKHPRQIDVSSIWSSKTQLTMSGKHTSYENMGQKALDDLAWKLGSYPFKSRVQFNHTFRTDDYKDGSYIPDKELARLVHYHDTIGKKVLLIGVGY
jgi:hypothetical protein